MKNPVLFIDLFFLLRPVLLIPVWGFCIFGYYHGTLLEKGTAAFFFWTPRSLEAFAWFVIFSCSVAAVHILNQLADIDVDKANRGLPLLAKGKVSIRAARISAFACAAVGISAPLFAYPFVSVLSCCTLIIGYFYSYKPVRLSGRCGLDFLANATGYGVVAFGVGWHISGAPLTITPFAVSAFPYFLLMCAGSISSTIPDIQGDKQYGKNTTAVALGVMKAHLLAAFFLSLAIAVSLVTRRYIALTCAICALPFYVLYCRYRNPRILEATYKIGGSLCMVMAAIIMPVFAGAALAVTALTFLYFRLRHRTSYPSLVPVAYEE